MWRRHTAALAAVVWMACETAKPCARKALPFPAGAWSPERAALAAIAPGR